MQLFSCLMSIPQVSNKLQLQIITCKDEALIEDLLKNEETLSHQLTSFYNQFSSNFEVFHARRAEQLHPHFGSNLKYT